MTPICHGSVTEAPPDPGQPQQNDGPARNFWVHEQGEWDMPQNGPLAGLIFMAAPSEELPHATSEPVQRPNASAPSEAASGNSSSSMGASWYVPAASDPWAEYLRSQGTFNAPPENTYPHQPRASNTHNMDSQPRSGEDMPASASQHAPQTQGSTSQVIRYELPPPTLPLWTQLPNLSFVTQPQGPVQPEQVPLLGGVGAAPCLSSVDSTHAPLIQGVFEATAASTERWLNRGARTQPTLQMQSGLEQANWGAMSAFRESQINLQFRQQQAKRAQRRLINLPTVVDRQNYDAIEGKCPICQDEYKERESVMRLACRHVFHSGCWTEYLLHEQAELSCPVCRGSARVVARFSYVAGCEFVQSPPASNAGSRDPSETRQSTSANPSNADGTRSPEPPQPQAFDVSTPPPRSRPDADTPSPYRAFPWWPSDNTEGESEQAYHVRDPFRCTLLIDP